MSQQQSFGCPNCAALLAVGSTACGHCQIRLTGPEAVLLWEVDQQIGALTVERNALIGALTTSSGEGPSNPWLGARAEQSQLSDPFRSPPLVQAPRKPKRSVSGQQLLLGLGALMLLSAAGFFLLVVWLIVGLVGQALIMGALTGAAVAGSVWATRRGLPAVAETAAVIATGFLFIDLSAAHALGLAGLDEFSPADYWAGASVLGGALLVVWDRLVPRALDGVALRRVLTYRPAAGLMFASTPWFLLASDLPQGAWASVAMLVVALTNLGCAVVALKLDEPRVAAAAHPLAPGVTAAPLTAVRVPLSAIMLLGSAALATALHALAGLGTGYDPEMYQGDRYAAFAVLLAVPVVLVVLSTRVGAGLAAPVEPRWTRMIPLAVVVWLGAVLGIPLMDATRPILVALSVLVAVAVSVVHLRLMKPSTRTGEGWLSALSAGAYVTQPLLFAVAFLLVVTEHVSLRSLLSVDGLTSEDPSGLWMVVPAAVWALSSVVGAVHRRSNTWVLVSQVAIAASLVGALWDTDAQRWMIVLLIAFTGNVALACVAVRRGSYAIAARARGTAVGDPYWAGIDRTAIVFGAAYAVGSLMSSVELSSGHQSFVLVSIGVLTLAYAAAPARLPFAYLGSLAISAGTANLMLEAAVETTEAYTAPLVLLLGAIGFVQRTRDTTLPTHLTMGPALSVAMGPSLLTSLGDGDELRLAAVTAVAIIAVLVGLSQRWKAPVSIGGLVLVVVAITQGGPLTAYVPGWLILGVGGAVLLAAGVSWERGVVAGRRAATWFATLQ